MILQQIIKDEAINIKEWLIGIRRDFHQHPELSTEEMRTQKKIIEYLEQMAIPYKTFQHHYGVVGLIQGKQPGKTVALRADMDALPMDDLKETPYRSINPGKAHACGHDAHMAVLLGAARLLNQHKEHFKGNVELIFQPAEETIGGAEPMIKDGVLEHPKVNAIFGLHVTPEIPVGKIGIKFDQMNGSSDALELTIKGKSSHGAYPQDGVDAILIASQTINLLQSIVSRNTDPREAAVITLGTIEGGTQANILAKEVKIKGTLRAVMPRVREKTIERIRSLVESTAQALGGQGIVKIISGYPALTNHEEMVNLVKENGEALLGKDRVITLKKVSLGVEDFAYFLEQVPGAFYRLGSGNQERGTIHPCHSNLFDIDEDCLVIGAALQALNALTFLNKEQK